MTPPFTPHQDIADQRLPLWVRGAIFYLSLPLFFFTAGWLKPWISLPLLALMAASVGMMVLRGGMGCLARLSARSCRSGLLILAGAVAFALLTGFSEITPQSTDQLKHSLILGDLIERTWPVRYHDENGGGYLCYGLGYYMVPAAAAKLLGVTSAGAATFVWSVLGLFFCFLGLAKAFGRLALPGVLLFLLCSGVGGLWFLIKTDLLHALVPIIPSVESDHLLDLGLFTTNLDSSTRMFYQPQHGIVGWLGGLLIYDLVCMRNRWAESAAVLAATFFWSPITAAGLGLIVVAALAANHRPLIFRPTIHVASALAIMSALIAYYLPHLPIAEKGFIWKLAEGGSWALWYGLFVTCFVLLPGGAVLWLDWKHPYLGVIKPVVIVMILLLLACPLYKLGYYGDLRMQLSGPAFLFIALAMTSGLLRGPAPGRILPYLFLCGVFVAGAFSPLVRTVENMSSAPEANYHIAGLRKNGLHCIKDLRLPGFDAAAQYLGKDTATPATWILRQNH